MDLFSIFVMEKQCLLHKWIALANMSKNFEEIKGN